MAPSDSEFEELRARVSRLESEVRAIRETGSGPVTRPVSALAEPPLLPPLLPVASLPPPRATKSARETPSTVWIAGVGAVIFLIGAIYGLTVSIQRGWISPPVRIGIGLGVGLALSAGAGRQLLRGHRGLGVALLAAGAGTWTFALYFGAHSARLLSPTVGLAGAATATLAAGWLAARARNDGAMAVGLVTGLAAPLAFSDGSGSVPGLLIYLLALGGSQLLVYYLTATGARWGWSRTIGAGGVWLVTLAGLESGRLESTSVVGTLLTVLAVTGLVLAWLPRLDEIPRWPGMMTVLTLLGLAVAAWQLWDRCGFPRENFAVVLVLLAGFSAGLAPLARQRTGGEADNLPLWLLALGFGLVAVPVAFDWKWVVLAWGAVAALLAWAARLAGQGARPRSEALQVLAFLAATAASLVWLILVFEQRRRDIIFLNRVFAGGLLASLAWGILWVTPGRLRWLAFSGLQAVAVNALAWELARAVPVMRSENTTLAAGPLLATLTYAVVGAGLWLRGQSTDEAGAQKAFRLCGYGWLAVAGVKLLASDLARADLLFRAVAALGVGAILIAAAWWASRRRAE